MPSRSALAFILLLISPVPLAQPLLAQTLLAQAALPREPYGQFLRVKVNTGERSRLTVKKNWLGKRRLNPTVPILVLAGHADSQGISPGTRGYAVAVNGARPMQPGITDETFWNLKTAQRIVKLGRQRGLNIRFYDPGVRTIHNGDDPRTNWSQGKRHAQAGGYALEIHYDAYGHDGLGSGVIPRVYGGQTVIDEYLAREFGSFPWDFRGVLGAPKRGITILEVGKLEGDLENKLRNPATRDRALNTIADRVVTTMAQALDVPKPVFQMPALPTLPANRATASQQPSLPLQIPPPPAINVTR
ncbi:dehydrogenase [Candidatus Synechococcus spongiarum]|uniref:dehydrogenase n=1 Tax=Candidatus Synechococcus spongiarum TaxID=431041 RepID=UPI00126848F0|nr:dehydrogenase [Candidatus Synechococcus spongiarum]